MEVEAKTSPTKEQYHAPRRQLGRQHARVFSGNAARSQEGDSPRGLAQWLFAHQVFLSLNLICLVVSTHVVIPAARPHTSRFLMLSYYNCRTGKYATGADDLYFIAFCITLLTGLRAGTMDYLLAPLARRWGVSREKDAVRFAEQGWMFIYYSVFWPMGMYLYCHSPYFLNMEQLWADWPQRETSPLMKFYMLSQAAFWKQQVLVINMEARRKDHWQMLTHHFVTIALLAGSYAYHQTRVGNLILLLTDAIDLILPLAKCLRYMGFTWICDVIFGLFVVVWLFSRHILYAMTCWSVLYDFPRMTPPACYRGSADQLEGPLPHPPDAWLYLLEPFRDPRGLICLGNGVMYAFLAFLVLLQGMMVVWFVFIVRIVVRVLRGQRAEDVRSDGEDDEVAADEHTGISQSLELEALEVTASGEAMDWRGWERRRTDAAPRLSRRRDRKELLNRIGCEKQIE